MASLTASKPPPRTQSQSPATPQRRRQRTQISNNTSSSSLSNLQSRAVPSPLASKHGSASRSNAATPTNPQPNLKLPSRRLKNPQTTTADVTAGATRSRVSSSSERESHSPQRTRHPIPDPSAVVPAAPVSVTSTTTTTASPSKPRRTRKRAHRQTSPPSAGSASPPLSATPTSLAPPAPLLTELGLPLSNPLSFLTTDDSTPPPSSLSQSAPTSRQGSPMAVSVSGPARLDHLLPFLKFPPPHAYDRERDSSADEWDMPTAAARRGVSEGLTWQQESLKSGNSSAGGARKGGRGERANGSGNTSGRESKAGAGAERNRSSSTTTTTNNRPTAAVVVPVSASLTWQQELLNSGSFSNKYNVPSSPTKNSTPNRRHQQRDEMTFGLSSLDLASSGGGRSDQFLMDDLSPPTTPSQSARQYRPSPRIAGAQIPPPYYTNTNTNLVHPHPSTPNSKSTEVRYAGPTFHNSPAPSSLPTPSFLLRRQQASSNTESVV